MKNRFILLIAALLVCARLSAVEINFTSPAFEVAKTSGGVVLDSSFTFTLGSFGSFVPTSSNTSDWLTNFTAVGVNGSATWDTDFTQFSKTATLANNNGVFATTNQAYIWGYNTQTTGTGTEWILFTNTNWKFPTSTNILPTSWDLSDSGTVAVVGTLNAPGSNTYFSLSAISGAAVPEPSTYAQIALGLGALGFFAYHRRKAA